MKNTTNILLMVVAILLLAILIDRRVNDHTLKADAGAINNIIFSTDPNAKDRFYIISTETKNILYYEYNQSLKSILLKATRQYEYDQQVQGAYASAGAQGDPYLMVKKAVEEQGKRSGR